MFTKKYRILILTLILTFIGTHNSQAVTSDFTDTDAHFAEFYTDTLWELGIMRGSNNMANVESSITRGEFSALTARAFLNPFNIPQAEIFPDIPKEHIFFAEINALYRAGIINGRENGTFDPKSTITRGEIALILSRLKNVEYGSKSINFTDVPKTSIYYDAVKKLTSISVINGYSDNTFKPFNNATRGESAKMLALMLEKLSFDTDTDTIKEISEKFIKSKYLHGDISTDGITGMAKEHIGYKNSVKSYIRSLNTDVSKDIKNLKISSITTSGALSEAVATYEITFNVNGNKNTYNAETKMRLFTNENGTKLYYFSDSFSEKAKVNLTWLVSENPPSHELTGVNAVSPPVFQVSKENLGVSSDDIGANGIRLYTAITKKLMDYANQNGFKIWPIYKTDFTLATSDTVLTSQSIQSNIIKSLIRHSISNGFDGLNIDFENVYQKNKSYLTNHIEDITLALHELGMIVSCDITKYEKTSATWSMCYDRDAIAQKCDYVMLMAYDQYYAGSKVAGPVSGIGWAQGCITRTLDEVPANKLVLGIPFYTRYWETRNGKVVSTKALSMTSAQKNADENSAKYEYDTTNSLTRAYWYNKSGNLCTYWVENAQSITKRVQLANKYNLAGVASWRQGFETADIWGAIEQELY